MRHSRILEFFCMDVSIIVFLHDKSYEGRMVERMGSPLGDGTTSLVSKIIRFNVLSVSSLSRVTCLISFIRAKI